MAVASKTWTAAYGRYVRLRITAQEVEVDTPNNRSKVRVTGQVYYDGGTSAHNAYPQTYTVTVNGVQAGRQTGFTYSLSSGGTKNLTTYTSGWIAHGSNGAKTVTVRGHITDNAGDTGTISQSYALTTIARASTLSSFSMPNYMKPDTTTTFNLGISRKSSSFTHDIQLRDGSTVIASWTGQGTPTTRSLTATQTNTLLRRMSSSTSRTMTLRVQTKSGSTNIGGALTRTATVYISSTVTPNVSALSVTIEGNAHAKDTVKRFVQNISRVSGKFTRTATGGASISSSRLQIRRKSGGGDLQTINSNSGTFPRVVALNGQYQARGIATDSRGRSSNTGWVDLSNFDVLAYSAPQITTYRTNRQTGTPTTVDIVRHGTFSNLSGSNVLTIKLQKRASGTTSWTNVVPDVTTPTANYGATITSTGHSVASSYDFRYYIIDQFGNSAEQISTVSTQRVVLDIHKNEGVGIGKIRERGVLDVDGPIYLKGDVELDYPTPAEEFKGLNIADPSGTIFGQFGFRNISVTQAPEGYSYVGERYNSGNAIRFMPGDEHPRIGWYPIIDRGLNDNGEWIRFFNRIQICWIKSFHLRTTSATSYQVTNHWEFPVAFSNENYAVIGTRTAAIGNSDNRKTIITANKTSTAQAIIRGYTVDSSTYTIGSDIYTQLVAIGRW